MDLEDLKRDLLAETACPIDWDANRISKSLQWSLNEHWEAFCEQYEADGESHFVDPMMVDIFNDEEFLRPALHNWRFWGPRARKDFLAATDHIVSTFLATREDYEKHYPPYGATLTEIVELTRQQDGLLFPEISAEHQRKLLHEVVAAYLDDFLVPTHQFIYVRADYAVGASRGSPTRVLCYDLNLLSRQAHAYPVLPSEMIKGRRRYGSFIPEDEEWEGP